MTLRFVYLFLLPLLLQKQQSVHHLVVLPLVLGLHSTKALQQLLFLLPLHSYQPFLFRIPRLQLLLVNFHFLPQPLTH